MVFYQYILTLILKGWVVEKINRFLRCFFSFFWIAPNDRGYGHGRFAGVFAVAQRQSECGRKAR